MWPARWAGHIIQKRMAAAIGGTAADVGPAPLPRPSALSRETKNGEAKYSGLHSLRHFYASWCINSKKDGGPELPPKMVQDRLGHSSIVMTMDTYGHLFPRTDDGAELAAAENALLAVRAT